MDEPTAGLDPGERNRFHNLLADVGREVIVILSTHIVDDVKELCSEMAIMNLGSIVYKGSPAEAMEDIRGHVWQKVIDRDDLERYQREQTIISEKMIAGKPIIHIYCDSDPGDGFTLVEPNLEDVFFSRIHQSALNFNLTA